MENVITLAMMRDAATHYVKSKMEADEEKRKDRLNKRIMSEKSEDVTNTEVTREEMIRIGKERRDEGIRMYNERKPPPPPIKRNPLKALFRKGENFIHYAV